MKAVILAAGEGTRINKGWTIVPKPLLEVGNKTIIERVIINWRKVGINELVIVTGFMSEHIKDLLRDGSDLGVKIEYVYNKNYQQGLLTSLLAAKEKVQGEFILCMADLFFRDQLIKEFLNALEKDKVLNSSNQPHYVCIDRKLTRVRRIEEKVKIQSSSGKVLQASLVLPNYDAVDTGIYLLQSSIFSEIERCLEQQKNSFPLVITEQAILGRFKTYDIDEEEIIDIDREQDVQYALEFLWRVRKDQ